MIVHSRVLEKSLLPWIICSQMVPILALAPIFIVVLGAIGLHGLLPKSIISAYLCFFPITIGMVKGFTSPDPMQLDLMRTWSATPRQVLSKLRWPSAVPYLFASLKVAISISLIGAIVAELPTGGEAGIGARLLAGSYYGQTDPDLVGAAGSRSCGLRPDRAGGPGREDRRTSHGGAAMNPRTAPAGICPCCGRHAAGAGAAAVGRGRRCAVGAADLLIVDARGDAAVRGRRLACAGRRATALGLAGALCGAVTTLALLRDGGVAARPRSGYWAMVLAVWLGSALCVMQLASQRPRDRHPRRALDLAVPLLFGAVVFYLWEVAVRGFGVSPVIMPAPSAAAARFGAHCRSSVADFVQTFVRGVLIGYVIGCGAGLLVAIVAQRFAFLGRGLLPLGNFFSALPLVGVAPIMVMWFGFDWPSKAAVVALVTFFPMLVNALAGLVRIRTHGARPDAVLWRRLTARP